MLDDLLTNSIRKLWRSSTQRPAPAVARNDDNVRPPRTSVELAGAVTATMPQARFLAEGEYAPAQIGTREYVAECAYILPVDVRETKRLDVQHATVTQTLGGLTVTKLKGNKMRALLDVGYGSGIWALDAAKALPDAHVFAVDMRPLPAADPPVNVVFQRADVLRGLPYLSTSFDFVHQRFVALGIPTEKWPVVLDEYHRVLKMGGKVEITEFTWDFKQGGAATQRIVSMVSSLVGMNGVEVDDVSELPSLLKAAGFTKVNRVDKKLHLGAKSEWHACLEAMVMALAPLAIQHELITAEQVESLLQEWQEECTRHKTFQVLSVFTAKKL